MNEYFIEYPKNQMYLCFDGRDGYANFKFEHNHDEYLFVEFVPKKTIDYVVLLKEYLNQMIKTVH